MADEKITSKSRKDDIFDAYKNQERELKKLRGEQSDTKTAKAEARTSHLETTHADINPENVIEDIAGLKAQVGRQLSTLGDQLEAGATRLTEVNELIAEKDTELKTIYGIERSADTLAALATTQDEQSAAFQEQMSETRATWTRETTDRQTQWSRDQQDHDYEFNRAETQRTNQLNDEIARAQKVVETEIQQRYDVVTSKETEQNEAIARTTELETKITEMETKHVTSIEAVKAEATIAAKRSSNFENEMKSKDFQAEITVLNGRIETTTAQLATAVDENADLKEQLRDAQRKVQEVAMGALESKGQSDLVTNLKSLVASQAATGTPTNNGKRS